ncbi:MAG TPA: hypothetical protein VNC22_16560 [Sporichthya sp.]|jgi:hypothetical protein|nr:hypothetical protein [Sporichthya sp.]
MTRVTRPARTAAAFAATALLLAACSDDDDVLPAEPAVTASATPTVGDFCSALVAVDSALPNLDQVGADEPSAAPTAESSAAPSAGAEPADASADPSADSSDSSDSSDSGDSGDSGDSSDSSDSSDEGGGGEGEEPPPSPAQIAAQIAFLTPLLAEEVRTAPASLASQAATVQRVLVAAPAKGNDYDPFSDPELVPADQAIDQFALSNCGFPSITGTASEYEFDGLPATTPGGPTSYTLRNEGHELHEMILARINDGVDLTPRQILDLPEEEAQTKISFIGFAFAEPGKSFTAFYDLKEPGRYFILCFMSKGSDAEHNFQGDGPPHFTLGMLENLAVGKDATPIVDSSAAPSASSSPEMQH